MVQLPNGVTRVKFDEGWTSVTARDGTQILQPVDAESAAGSAVLPPIPAAALATPPFTPPMTGTPLPAKPSSAMRYRVLHNSIVRQMPEMDSPQVSTVQLTLLAGEMHPATMDLNTHTCVWDVRARVLCACHQQLTVNTQLSAFDLAASGWHELCRSGKQKSAMFWRYLMPYSCRAASCV
jgi:hypothetical protein